MIFTLQFRNGKYPVTVEPTSTLHDLRLRIFELTKVPPENQKLLLWTKKLSFSDPLVTLIEAGFREGAKLLLIGSTAAEVASATAAPTPAPAFAPEITEDDLVLVVGDEVLVCSYSAGYCRQDLYMCLTCSTEENPAAVCYGCKRLCHADHDLRELHTKRHFRCDCGTPKFPKGCQLSATNPRPPNTENKYDRSFSGIFCHCNGKYDPLKDTMIQCWICQDWFHDTCCGLPADIESSEDETFVCRTCLGRHPFLEAVDKFCPEPAQEAQEEPPPKRVRAEAAPPMATVKTIGTADKLFCCNLSDRLCKCAKCRELYDSHGLQFICKKTEDEDCTGICILHCAEDDAEGGTTSEAGTSADESGVAATAALTPIQQSLVAHGMRLLQDRFSQWISSLPAGHIISRREVLDFFADLQRQQGEAQKDAS